LRFREVRTTEERAYSRLFSLKKKKISKIQKENKNGKILLLLRKKVRAGVNIAR